MKNLQEFYWKSADLTGQQIILKKPKGRPEAISNLVWIRCEKMDDAVITLLERDLDQALLRILEDTLDYLRNGGGEIDTMTEKTYEYYKQQLVPQNMEEEEISSPILAFCRNR